MKPNPNYISAPYEESGAMMLMSAVKNRLKSIRKEFGKKFKLQTSQRGGMIFYRIYEG